MENFGVFQLAQSNDLKKSMDFITPVANDFFEKLQLYFVQREMFVVLRQNEGFQGAK